MILCKCPTCDKAYKVKDEMGGKYAKCACGNRFLIPQGMESAPQPAPDAPKMPEPADVLAPIASVTPTVTAPPKAPEPVVINTPTVSAPPKAPEPEPVVTRTPPASVTPAATAVPRPQQPVPAMPGARAVKADEGYGGLGRLPFILAVVVVCVLGAIIAIMARSNPGPVFRIILPAAWLFVSAVTLFIVTQSRLLNIGYNEWLAIGLPILIGHCALLPEGYKDSVRKNPEVKKQATMMMVKVILIDVVFYAAVLVFLTSFYLHILKS